MDVYRSFIGDVKLTIVLEWYDKSCRTYRVPEKFQELPFSTHCVLILHTTEEDQYTPKNPYNV